MTKSSTDSPLETAIAAKKRLRLGEFPTPLHEAPRLSERLGARVLIKRDDLTGFALGGNKVRKLEFLIADAVAQLCDVVITTGGSQSNHARITAAACGQANISCHLVLDRGRHPGWQGNQLLDGLFGAEIHFVENDDPAVASREMERLAASFREEGKSPYVIPRGGSIPQGAIGYAAFVPELLAQLDEKNVSDASLYVATGSTGTHSGILAGLAAEGSDLRVEGVSVSREARQQEEKLLALSNATLEYIGISQSISPENVRVDDRFRGPGYGIPTEATMDAVKLLALDEGMVLDPVYTGKAMSGLIAHVREGRIGDGMAAVFLHSGGSPALFAYNQEVVTSLQSSGVA